MTWEQLFKILQNMHDINHTAMKKPVHMVVDGVLYETDIFESVTTGEAYILPAMVATKEEDDGEE